METRARRSSRASGPVAAPPELPKPFEMPAEVETEVVSASPAFQPAEPSDEPAQGVEIKPDPKPSASLPAIDTFAKGAENRSLDQISHFGRDAFAALAQSQAALARGLEALSAEMAGLTLLGIETAARAATNMLGIKTVSDAIDVNTGFACNSLDVWVSGSAKISALGAKLAAETSRPFLTRFGKGWGKPSSPG